MSAGLERLKQQTARDEQQQLLDSPQTMEILASILTAVEALNTTIARLSERQKELAGFVKVMDQQQTLQMERLSNHLLTSPQSVNVQPQIESVESRLGEIESTLTEFVTALDGRQLHKAVSTLIAEASRNRTDVASATDRAAEQVAASTQLVKQAYGAASRIEGQAKAAIDRVATEATGTVAGQTDKKIATVEARADRVMAMVAHLEARQLWTASGAMCLALLPAATVVIGAVLIVAGVVFGWETAVTTDAAAWLRWVRGLGAAAGTVLALCGLAAAVRWVTVYVSTWDSLPRRRRK